MAVSRSASIVNIKVRIAIACMGVTCANREKSSGPSQKRQLLRGVGFTAEQTSEVILHRALDQNLLTAICRSVRSPAPEAAALHPGDTLLQLHRAVMTRCGQRMTRGGVSDIESMQYTPFRATCGTVKVYSLNGDD